MPGDQMRLDGAEDSDAEYLAAAQRLLKKRDAEIDRLQRRVVALEHMIIEELEPRNMTDEANAMLVRTARDAVARRASEALADEQSYDSKMAEEHGPDLTRER